MNQTDTFFEKAPVPLVAKTDEASLLEKPVEKKQGRKRRELQYKSIVRTRSQKLREELELHDSQLTQIAEFYAKRRFEPRMNSNNDTEVALATYIHNLRTTPVSAELAVRVSKSIPWFQWTKKNSGFGDVLVNLGFFLLFASLVALSASVQIYVRDVENIRNLLKWYSAHSGDIQLTFF